MNIRKKEIAIIIFVIVIILAIPVASVISNKKDNTEKAEVHEKTPLEELCDTYKSNDFFDVADDGSWIEIDTNPKDIEKGYDPDADDALIAVCKELGFSDALRKKMGNTSALDGKQHDENKNAYVEWTFFPNCGLEVLFEIKNPEN